MTTADVTIAGTMTRASRSVTRYTYAVVTREPVPA
jgi:hypothetical protein